MVISLETAQLHCTKCHRTFTPDGELDYHDCFDVPDTKCRPHCPNEAKERNPNDVFKKITDVAFKINQETGEPII